MFTRSTSHVLSATKSELSKIGVRYTAQSKKNRIDVQLLKDFPGIGVKGQVVAVKASAMASKLYPHNGAVYMNFPGAQPTLPVVTKSEAAAVAAALKNAQQQAKKDSKKRVKLNPILKSEIEQNKKTGKMLLSMDDILSIDVDAISTQEVELIFSKLPKKLIFVKKSKASQLLNPLQTEEIVAEVEKALARYVRESDAVSKFFRSEETSFTLKSEAGEAVESIQSLGAYYLEASHAGKDQIVSVIVNSK